MPDSEAGRRLRVLVTNDDGIRAPALALLAQVLSAAGHEVQVAAPAVEQTGCGASVGQVDGSLVSVQDVELAGAPGVPALAVAAPPALAVLAACQGQFGRPPDVVVSGTNVGYNTGSAVLHSGTLSAALTAAVNGIPGIALSTARDAGIGFATAAELCASGLGVMVRSLAARTVLNVNVPDLPLAELAGVRATRFAAHSLVSLGVAREADGLRLHRLWSSKPSEDDSDVEAVRQGYVSVTTAFAGVRGPEPEAALASALAVRLPQGAAQAPAETDEATVTGQLTTPGTAREEERQ